MEPAKCKPVPLFNKFEQPEHEFLQESDLYKPLLLDIGKSGLNYAYHKHFQNDDDDQHKYTKTNRPINVIVLGGGISGLVAGYELAQVGHKVTILEMQHRVGGKVKTIGDSHFYPGLWADSGAMRTPGTGEPGWDKKGPCHYLTDFYVNHFQLPKIPFLNADPNGCTYFKFYDQELIQKKEWKENRTKYCDKFWPGWDKKLEEVEKMKPGFRNEMKILDVDTYFDATVAPLVNQLRKWLDIDPVAAWDEWVTKWSFFSVEQFLRSSYEQVKIALDRLPMKSKFPTNYDEDLAPLADLLPWPHQAVIGYSTYTYILPYQLSLLEYLRDSHLGQWWREPMYTLKDGLRMLPEAFMKKGFGWNKDVDLSKNIVFGVTAHTIEYTEGSVKVFCRNNTTQEELKPFEGDRLIITVPINLIRGMKFSPPLPQEYYQAFENLNIISGSKIMIQCRTRFWQEQGIQGGCSTTNMPIGRMFYQSNPGFKVPTCERGILLCYAWKSEALIFGAYAREEDAIAEAVKQIAEIHPEVKEQFEVGAIQSWYTDQAAIGCSTFLQPEETNLMRILMHKPYSPIYFGGEGVSFTNGWIQGAFESGLRAAYQLYVHNETNMEN